MHSTVPGQTKVRNTAGACGAETIIPVFFGGGAVVEILTIDTHTHIFIYIYLYIFIYIIYIKMYVYIYVYI